VSIDKISGNGKNDHRVVCITIIDMREVFMESLQRLLDRDRVLDRIFNPASIAVIGVSVKGNMFGTGIMNALNAIGFEGVIYPVNPKGGQFDGMKIYTSLQEIPSPVDFAIIVVPAEHVPGALEECRKMGIAGAEILSAGFSETGTRKGKILEEQIRKIAEKGIRVVGPNCFGIYSPASGLTLLPGPDLSRESGPVAFLSQSGGMSVDFAHIGKWMGFRFSKVVSFGNGVDLRETELLEYFGRDPETRVITMYMEGVEDGRGFLEVLKRVASEKPVIINKGGLSEAGSRAVESHTASMGGSRVIWESALRQAGAIQVGDLLEMAQTALAFTLLPWKTYHGISVAGGGGALAVSGSDAAERFGFELPLFDDSLREKILSVLPRQGASAKNPVDAAHPLVGPDAYREVFLHAGSDSRVDAQVLVQLLHHYKTIAFGMGIDSVKQVTPYRELATAMREAMDTTGKPVILVMPDFKQGLDSMDVEEMIREARQIFLEKGIPVFDDLGHCFRALSHVSRFAFRRRLKASS
jgi:acyl-CoA synthetase (NDP forming)